MKKLFVEDTISKIGQDVELYGWVDSVRDHKQIVFIDLRDRTGIVQVVGDQKFKILNTSNEGTSQNYQGDLCLKRLRLLLRKKKTGMLVIAWSLGW